MFPPLPPVFDNLNDGRWTTEPAAPNATDGDAHDKAHVYTGPFIIDFNEMYRVRSVKIYVVAKKNEAPSVFLGSTNCTRDADNAGGDKVILYHCGNGFGTRLNISGAESEGLEIVEVAVLGFPFSG